MISSNDFRPGVTVEIDGNVWQVVAYKNEKLANWFRSRTYFQRW